MKLNRKMYFSLCYQVWQWEHTKKRNKNPIWAMSPSEVARWIQCSRRRGGKKLPLGAILKSHSKIDLTRSISNSARLYWRHIQNSPRSAENKSRAANADSCPMIMQKKETKNARRTLEKYPNAKCIVFLVRAYFCVCNSNAERITLLIVETALLLFFNSSDAITAYKALRSLPSALSRGDFWRKTLAPREVMDARPKLPYKAID